MRTSLIRPILTAVLPALLHGFSPGLKAQNNSLRFFGNGVNDIDRVKIRLDAPAKPVDVSGSFTVEFFMKANSADNNGYVEDRFDGDGWITGNIILDRDIYGSGDFGDFGISIGSYTAGGSGDRGICFGIDRAGNGRSIVAQYNVADEEWHHIAVTRDSANGLVRIFIDGVLRTSAVGPTGNISYRNGRTTSWPQSDPFLVLGAEKHDAGSAYPSYNGRIDELRISGTVRYTADFAPPVSEFTADAFTAGLYHFNEGAGDTLRDLSNAPGGPSHGVIRRGGTPQGPVWDSDNPFPLSLSLKIIPQGFYRPGTDRLIMRDTVTVYLRNSVWPYQKADSSLAVIDSASFQAVMLFNNAQSGSYYADVRHRNSVETWTSVPVSFTAGVTSVVDLTASSSSAYGGNLTQSGTRYCVYSGDVNRDGTVDGTDVLLTDNAAFIYLSGYFPEDLNGDNSVDATDIAIADNNASSFISRIIP